MKSQNTKKEASKKPASSQKKRRLNSHNNSMFMGIFWVVSGMLLLLNSFFTIPLAISSIFLLILSLYLLLLAAFKRIRRVYFALGVLMLVSFVGFLISSFDSFFLLWPTVIGICGLGVILYGILFKREKNIAYLTVGVVLLVMAGLVFITVSTSFSLSALLSQSWPVLLVIIGIYHIGNSITLNRKQKLSDQDEDEDEDDLSSTSYSDADRSARNNTKKTAEKKSDKKTDEKPGKTLAKAKAKEAKGKKSDA